MEMGPRSPWHKASLAESTISPVMLSQPSPGRIQGVNTACYYYLLSRRNVFRLRTLSAIGNLHGYGLTLLKSLVSFSLYCAVMNENVFATLL